MGLLRRLFPTRESPPSAPPAAAQTLGRNEPCWCGSEAKYKLCHLEEDRAYFARLAAAAAAACRGST